MSGTQPLRDEGAGGSTSAHSSKQSCKHSFELDELHIRRIVAANPNTPKDVLERLAKDSAGLVRRHVAENPHTAPEVLKLLAYDQEQEVRLAVAENSSTPTDLLARLGSDPDVDVRYGVAENPHMPMSILAELARDDNPYIRCRALKTLKILSPELQTKFHLARRFFFP